MERPTYGWNNFYASIRASGFHLLFNIIIIALFFFIGQTIDMVQQIEGVKGGFSMKLVGLFFSIVLFSLLSWSSLRMIFDLTTLSRSGQTFDSTIYYLTSPEDSDRDTYYGGKFGIAFPRFIAVLLPLVISVFSFVKGYTDVGIYSCAAAIFIFVLLVLRSKVEFQGIQILSHRVIFGSLFVTVLVLTFFAIVTPFLFTRIVFGLNLILIGLGSMLFGLTLVSHIFFDFLRTRKKDSGMHGFISRPYPIILFAIVVPLIVGAVPWSDNHEIRLIDEEDMREGEENTLARKYTSLEDAFEAFKTHALQNGIIVEHQNDTKIVPVFFIASQGGGLRAAYWTSLALSHLERQLPGFENNIFALTGASGGSVGNAIYLASRQLDDSQIEKLTCEKSGYIDELIPKDPSSSNKRFCLLDKAVGQDYLSSVTTSFLYNDLLYTYLPIPIPGYDRDRATYLEQSFERGFSNVYLQGMSAKDKRKAGLAQSYMTLYSKAENAPWQPILMGTTTVQELGMLGLYAPFSTNADAFSNKIDLYEKIKAHNEIKGLFDMRISTVALNSARFPYITPTGTLDATKERSEKLHLADAGYFDNFGASVTTDMISTLFLGKQSVSQLSAQKNGDATNCNDENKSNDSDGNAESAETAQTTEANSENSNETQSADKPPVFVPIPVILTNSLFDAFETKEQTDDTRFDIRKPAIHSGTKSWFAHEISSPLQALLSIRGGLANTMLHEMIGQQAHFKDYVCELKNDDAQSAQLESVLFNKEPIIVLNYKDIGTPSSDPTKAKNEELKGIDPPLGWWLSEKSKCKLSTQVFHYFDSQQDVESALARCDNYGTD